MSERLQVTIRTATPDDTPAMLALTSQIWDGDDYVPQVWQEWLGDPLGLLVTARGSQGRVVGLGKLSQLTPDDWWLQGLRTHPDFEGRGVAAQVHDHLVGYWEKHGRGALRLATNAVRYPVHHLCERTGFQRVGEYSYFEASVLQEQVSDLRLIVDDDAQSGLEHLRSSPLLGLMNGLIDLGWEWQAPSLGVLQEVARQGRLLKWQEQRGLMAYYLDEGEHRGKITPVLALAACQLSDLSSLLEAFRRFAAWTGYAQAGWVAPLRPELIASLEEASFRRTWDGSVYVFEKQHSGSSASGEPPGGLSL